MVRLQYVREGDEHGSQGEPHDDHGTLPSWTTGSAKRAILDCAAAVITWCR
jgi:hypothetical protein